MKKRRMASVLLAILMLLSGCTVNDLPGSSVTDAAGTEISVSDESGKTGTAVQLSANTEEMFTDQDLEVGYDEETSVPITFSEDSVLCDSNAVQVSGSTVTISEEGTYLLSGTLQDGMVIVDAEDTDKIQLVLDGVTINSATSAAIYVRQADKVFITTAPDTENMLSNGGQYTAIDENNIDAVIFSKSDLTLNGSGVLTIQAEAGHGVVSKDDLVLTSGTYRIEAASHGISGKDSVRIANGSYTIIAGKDGIHAENSEDTSLGFLYVAGGMFEITAEGDGISAENYALIEDGEYTIQTGGGSAAAVQKTSQNFGPKNTASTEQTEESESTKGIKAGTDLILNDGIVTIDSADDSLHSNGNLTVTGGSFEIASGDDGIHADSAVMISGGNINISQSYEGIEGLSIEIAGGEISLVSSDDGLNAAGGNDNSGFGGRGGDSFGETEGAFINLSGGIVHINASGDGIDSNGSLTVTGGETYVSGPTDGQNGALDYSGEAVISGGIFVAAGSAGMAQNFGTSSTQGVMMVSISGSAGSTLSLTDSSGTELVSWQPEKEYTSVIISCPEITQGSIYTLIADGNTMQITMDSLVYGSEGMGGGPQGGMDRGKGRGSMGEKPENQIIT